MSLKTTSFHADLTSPDYRYKDAEDYIIRPIREVQEEVDIVFQEFVQELPPVSISASYKKYAFKPFYHAYVCSMIKELNRYGIEGLLDPKGDTEISESLLRQSGSNTFDFADFYNPEKSLINGANPEENFDFDFDGPYGIYNWELFFHGPLYIAGKLTQNQKFEEAQKWLHYLFNPTETDGHVPQRYWKVKPFHEMAAENSENSLLQKLSSGDASFNRQLDQWMKNPFQPHVIARLRTVAYMKTVVMKYLDNLIQWADSLFRKDTIESINEATQLYILASQILGEKPNSVEKGNSSPQTVSQVMGGTGNFITAIEDLESELGSIETGQEVDIGSGVSGLNSLLYFCTSPNDKLLGYWDTVADRLFKIRHCMNIEGINRSLALFEPPIDPALLVKASAAGLDLGTVLTGSLSVTIPHYRFRVLIQKAVEICNDVKNMGQTLLSVLEKKDAEELAVLRASQEVKLLNAIRQIKNESIKESEETVASLQNALELANIRLQYYTSREYMNRSEQEQLSRLDKAMDFQIASQVTNTLASVVGLIPDFEIGVAGAFASPFSTGTIGGKTLFNSLQGASMALGALSTIENHKATKSGIRGGYDRRMDDWQLQAELTEKEIEQLTRQIAAAEIRLAITERDLTNHDMQITQSQEVETFMKDKYTNRDLYNWMTTQVSSMYFQCYQMAFDVARMAEQAFRHERAEEDTSFIQFGHWDSLRKGLLAGEKLQTDLRRMEVAYLEQNKREYELTKHISLSILSPIQLIQLRETGTCDIKIPEVLFDLDHPGHYMRRIKSVRVTIPCVTGPYTNVNAKLTLRSSSIRKNTENPGSYAYTSGDPRFRHDVPGVQAIATSSGQNDGGLFELNFQDERYLPFEGAGAISQWTLELSDGFKQFDYDTISDVILHMNYMAREGGAALKAGAKGNIEDGLNEFANDLVSNQQALQRVFSLKTHFPNALYELLQPTGTADQQTTSFEVKTPHFPHFLSEKTITLKDNLAILIKKRNGETMAPSPVISISMNYGSTSLAAAALADASASYPLIHHQFDVSGGSPIDTWAITATGTSLSDTLNSEEIEDVYLILNYTIS